MEESLPSTPDAVLELRKEFITSPTAEEDTIFRTAHFLKPSSTSIDESLNLSSNLLPSIRSFSFEPKTWDLRITFNGWRNPQLGWKKWVAKMVSLHEPTWKKAGVYEAILNSTYQIHRNNDMILGVAERWCSETSSFIFPWGEATITLEDMVVSGYSTLGSPVFSSLQPENLRGIEARLIHARKELGKTEAHKATHGQWRKKFMNSESDIEHEAFLSLWLSRYVLPTTSPDVINPCVFPIAILLSIGTRIALAPAVLASIYRDLRLLKEKIDSLTRSETETRKTCQGLLVVQSPLQLVQVWIWERFIELQPNPNPIKCGETRLSRWNNVRCKFENVRMVLASAATKDRFTWRPYAKTLENWDFPKFYAENGMCILVDSTLHDEWMSFVKCLRVSGLVGLDYVEKYLPHRVAMQFGYDQDLPGYVVESILSSEIAWSDYTRPLGEVGLYIPPRAFKGGVTRRYKDWWETSMLSESELSNGKKNFKGKNIFSTGAPVLRLGLKTSSETSLMTAKRKKPDALTAEKSEPIFRIKSEENVNLSAFSPCSSKIARKLSPGYLADINNSPVPPGFPPKCNEAVVGYDSESAEEDNVIIAELLNRRRRRGEAENSSGMVGVGVEKQDGNDGGPKNPSETSLMTAKRKKPEALTAEKSEPIFRIKSEENANLSAFSLCSSKIARKLNHFHQSPGYLAKINNSPVPPGFPPKFNEPLVGDDFESAEDNVTIAEVLNRHRSRGEAENSSGMVGVEVEKQVGNEAEINKSPVPPGFPKKFKEAVVGDDSESAEEDNVSIAELLNRRRRRGEAENSSGMVGLGVEKQVGNGGETSSRQNAEKGSPQNLEGSLLEKVEGGNAAATAEIERIWLRLEANVSWIEKRLTEMRKMKKKNQSLALNLDGNSN